jgi:hypothetical protein
VLAGPDVMDLFADELAGLAGGTFTLALGPSRPLKCPLLRHGDLLLLTFILLAFHSRALSGARKSSAGEPREPERDSHPSRSDPQ